MSFLSNLLKHFTERAWQLGSWPAPKTESALALELLQPGLMKDHDQQARATENFAGPVDFETPRPDLPVHFLNFQKPWPVGRGLS